KKDANVVLLEDLVTLGYGGADFVGIVIAMKGEVEIPRIVSDHSFSRLRWSDVVSRTCLVKVSKDGSLLPDFLIELAVDYRRRLKPGQANRLSLFGRNRCSLNAVGLVGRGNRGG